MWSFEWTNKFKNQYKGLESQKLKKVNSLLQDLASSENPTKLGEYKKYKGVWAIKITKGDRLLYNVRFRDNVIELIRVGKHDVYER